MKKIFVFIVCSLVCLQVIIAQEEGEVKSKSPILVTIPTPREDTKFKAKNASSLILQKLQKLIGTDYPSSFGVAYKVIPSYSVTGVRTIETMEVQKYVDLELYLKFKGIGFHQDSIVRKYKATGSDVNEEQAIQKALNTIFTGGGKIFKFPEMIDSVFNARYNVNGPQTLQALKGYPITTVKDVNSLMTELQYFGDYPEMETEVEAFRNKILATRSELFCKNDLPKLKISVESGVYSATDVLAKLLAIAPDASCADDVLALAKLMGSQSMAKSQADADKLNIILTLHQENNINEWRRRQ